MKRTTLAVLTAAIACGALLSACGEQAKPVEHWTKEQPSGPANRPVEGGVVEPTAVKTPPRPMGAEKPVVKKLPTQVLPAVPQGQLDAPLAASAAK